MISISIACIIPTYNGRALLERLLKSLQMQTVKVEIFIVDSSSNDGTQELAMSKVDNVTVIPSCEFNHGGTRQRIVKEAKGFTVYVFLTQDACLANPDAIAKLVEPFHDPKVGAVCGRQLPHLDASPFAQHARLFNYPKGLQIKTINDISSLGIKTAFMSNSFAAYRGEALNAVAGFPEHVISTEDMYVAAKMLLGGWKVVYAGEALSLHSHNYTIIEEFNRYFDLGVFHARESWIRQQFGGAGGEGYRFVKSEIKFLGLRRIHLWPNAVFRNAAKLIAYKLGQQEARLPVSLKRKLSMHKRYWDGPFSNPSFIVLENKNE